MRKITNLKKFGAFFGIMPNFIFSPEKNEFWKIWLFEKNTKKKKYENLIFFRNYLGKNMKILEKYFSMIFCQKIQNYAGKKINTKITKKNQILKRGCLFYKKNHRKIYFSENKCFLIIFQKIPDFQKNIFLEIYLINTRFFKFGNFLRDF